LPQRSWSDHRTDRNQKESKCLLLLHSTKFVTQLARYGDCINSKHSCL